MSTITWNGAQSGHNGDIGYAANYSGGVLPTGSDSVVDAYGGTAPNTGTSNAASWSLTNINIMGGTFNGSVTTTHGVSNATFNAALTLSGAAPSSTTTSSSPTARQ